MDAGWFKMNPSELDWVTQRERPSKERSGTQEFQSLDWFDPYSQVSSSMMTQKPDHKRKTKIMCTIGKYS